MTVVGQWSVAELKDLIAAKDVEMNRIQQDDKNNASAWKAQNPTVYTAWKKDLDALVSRYNYARNKALAFITTQKINPVPENFIPAQQWYVAVLKAVKQKGGAITKGDLQDLFTRELQAGIKPIVGPIPQPGSASDADLNVLNSTAWVPTPKQTFIGIGIAAVFGLFAYGYVTSPRRDMRDH